MNPTLQAALVSGIVGVLVAYISTRANRRSQDAGNAIQGKAVDLSVLTASIDDLKERLENAEGRVDSLESDLETERQARLVAIQRAEAAESRAARLEARVTLLEQTLREHDIAVPPVS